MFVSLPARALTSKLTSDRSRLVRPPEKSNPDPEAERIAANKGAASTQSVCASGAY